MLIKPLSRVVIASALIFAFSACGDDSSGPSFDDEATTEETEDVAYDAVEIAANVIDQLNFDGPDIALSAARGRAALQAAHDARMGPSRLPPELPMPGVSFTAAGGIQLSAAPGCAISAYGNDGELWDWIDVNENGIADDWGLETTCVSQDSSDLENIVTRTDKLKITIRENNASLYGYRVTQAYSTTYRDEHGDGYGGGYTGDETLDVRADAATHAYQYEGKEWNEEAGERHEGVAGSKSDVGFDPVGTIVFGDPLPNGEFVLAGRRYFASTGGLSLSFTLETTDPLVFSAACWNSNTLPPFTDGTLVGHLNGRSNSATFTIDFNACDDFTITTDHTSDEPVVVSAGAR